jgi:hypothetical protein
MKDRITTPNPSRAYFFLQINGRINSMHRCYQDAVGAGLILKCQFPNDDVKLYEAQSEELNLNTGLH